MSVYVAYIYYLFIASDIFTDFCFVFAVLNLS